MNKKRGNTLQLLIVIVSIIGFLICAVWLIYYFISNHQSKQQLDDMRENYVLVEPIDTAIPEPVTEESEHSAEIPAATPIPGVVIDGIVYPGFEGLEVPERAVDFAGLQAENEHIYAWIYIPNTLVDYPILQHPDDAEYYLKRNVNDEKSTAGSIFTQYYNSKDFNDNNTVIYGHNMKNDSMFGFLHNYEDEAFFEENPYVYIYTESDIRVYQIFAAYVYGDAHLLLSFDMEDDAVYGNYLESLTTINGAGDHFNWDIGVSSEDKIITLSTCVANKANSRYLVQAKLIAVEEIMPEKNENMTDTVMSEE